MPAITLHCAAHMRVAASSSSPQTADLPLMRCRRTALKDARLTTSLSTGPPGLVGRRGVFLAKKKRPPCPSHGTRRTPLSLSKSLTPKEGTSLFLSTSAISRPVYTPCAEPVKPCESGLPLIGRSNPRVRKAYRSGSYRQKGCLLKEGQPFLLTAGWFCFLNREEQREPWMRRGS